MSQEKIVIGISHIEYSRKGNVVSAGFEPKVEYQAPTDVIATLQTLKGGKDLRSIRQNAEAMLAGWFNTVTGIELADRNEYEMVSRSFDCTKYDNDVIKTCKIEYSLIKRKTTV